MPLHDHTPRRRRLPRAVLTGALALGLSLLGAGTALAAPTTTSVTLTATPSVNVGETVDVAIGLLGAVDVYAYEVTVTFDPALFEATSAAAPTRAGRRLRHGDAGAGQRHPRPLATRQPPRHWPATSRCRCSSPRSAAVPPESARHPSPSSTPRARPATQTDAASATVAVEAVDTEPPGGGDPPTRPPLQAAPEEGPLAFTGFAMGGVLLLVAGVAVGVGVLLVLRRRMAGTR